MAKLINGNGNKAIWAVQDADLIAALAGNVTGISKVGNKFVATQEDANTIGLSDGVIVTKEGRRIQLDAGSVDLFDIPTGTTGVTSYYIIGYHLITNSDSSQSCETFVQKMDNATDVITENTFRGGATEVYVSCYRVVQDGLNIDSINALLPELENISTLMLDLDDKANKTTEARSLLVAIPNAQTFNSKSLNSGKKISDYDFIGFTVLNSSGVISLATCIPVAFFKGFTSYTDNRFMQGLGGSTENLIACYVDDTHIIVRSSASGTQVNVFGINIEI